MDFKQSIRSCLAGADFITGAYLADITPAEMLVRPVPAANHIAWQLGHLIQSERFLVETAAPGTMPPLPAGFAERHTSKTAGSDAPAGFLSKEEYLSVARDVRAGTLRTLDRLTDAELDRPVSGKLPPFVQRAGDCLVAIGPHWIGHAGQWAVVRRKLGRDRLF